MNKRSILVIDDAPQHLRLAVEILKVLDIQLSVATNTDDAMKIIEKNRPDLVLLDVQLGADDVSGFEFCRQIKTNRKFKSLVILFITGFSDQKTIQSAFSAGGADYISKPYTKEELLARVRNQLSLIKERERSKKAYEELNHFAHTVSHDLKSPILLIEQLSECLLDVKLSKDQRRLIVEQMMKKCQQTEDMITKMLSFSEVAQHQLNFARIEIKELIESICQEQKQLHGSQKFTVDIGEMPPLIADELLINTLFQNIISNAFKFSQKTINPTIIIKAELESNFINYIISDNGIGFDEQRKDKLFKIFERLHTSQAFSGSGVGLAISKRVMDKYQGQIEIVATHPGVSVYLKFPKKYL